MPQYQDRHTREGSVQHQESALIDGLLRNGVDGLGARRAHLREMTMARQAAERRYARRGLPADLDGPAQMAMARARAVALRDELARIDADHRLWMIEHEVNVVDRPRRRRRSLGTAQQ